MDDICRFLTSESDQCIAASHNKKHKKHKNVHSSRERCDTAYTSVRTTSLATREFTTSLTDLDQNKQLYV